MKPYLIAPSIVSADHVHLQDAISECESAKVDWIHVDVMDGHFVPNLTMGPFMVRTYRRATQLPLDVHLMIEKPERYLEAFAKAGASHLTVHVETCPHIYKTLEDIRSLGCQAGVTLNPGTPVVVLEPVLHLVDLVLIMSVSPGFSNQEFLPSALGRVKEARRLLDAIKSPAYLEVDGGVSADNIGPLREAGADAFVTAHAIFSNPKGIAEGVAALRQAAERASAPKARAV